MGGALAQMMGHDDEQVALAVARGYTCLDAGRGTGIDAHYLDSMSETQWGYCTQFVISGDGLLSDSIREQFVAMSESAVVVGDVRIVRVHVHALDPGPALTLGSSLGQLSQIDIQNMNQQNKDFASGQAQAATSGG